MTVTLLPGAPVPTTLAAAPSFDLEAVLASIDTMAAQKPVAAQIVSIANSDDTDARTLARTLAADVALAGRVMKLANSAYFGMRGRVTSLQFAVTVVGFTTVRTMATVALTDLDDESRLPADFWRMSTCVALGASTLAPRFGERPQDALCLGLLAPLGVALLHHNDADGYAFLARALSFVVGTTTAYALNRRWAFQVEGGARRAGGFALLYGTTFFLILGVNALALAVLPESSWRITLAWAISQGLGTAWNFVMLRLVVFRS